MNEIIAYALKRRLLMVGLLLTVIGVGLFSFGRLNIEAYPDPVPPLVDIVTQSSGQSAEEIERYVTIPIEVQMSGIPHVTAIRTISLFGLSDVKLQFSYDFTYEQAEQWVINRLAQLPPLPNGAQPSISPWSPVGEIYRYRVTGPEGYSVTDLRTLQDWILERRFKAVPGVADVNGWGGKTKTYDVVVDLDRLSHLGLGFPQVIAAIGNANSNVGGQTIDIGAQSAVVRGVGLVRSMDDLRATLVGMANSQPVYLSDVAKVQVGHLPRLGIAGEDASDDVVEGIILMRRGEQSLPTLARVKAEIDLINSGSVLPPGVHIEKIYDRTELIEVTTHTVLHNMVVGMLLIFAVQWAFLGNLRSALIVAMTIPFALFFAVTILLVSGESANLLSVGAIDFGLIVDATVIMVENIFRHLVRSGSGKGDEFMLHDARPAFGLRGSFAVIANSAREVNRGIFFSAAIIVAGFIPLFTLTGVEGHIFGPMARTYAYAILGGLIATFTIAPALSGLLLTRRLEDTETAIVRQLNRAYQPALAWAMARRRVVVGVCLATLTLAALLAFRLGLEFLPKLEEGNLWIRATMPNSVSLIEGNRYVNQMRALIGAYPEVVTVVSQNGRPDDGTDPTGFFNAEFYVPLKPADRWPGGVDKSGLTRAMSEALAARFPGVEFNFSQTIEDNVEEAASGVKGENSVKLFGPDLHTLEHLASQIEGVMQKIPGIADLAVFRSLGQPTFNIVVDRAAAASYGLAPGDINATIQAAIGGQPAGDLYEEGSDRHFPIVVRLDEGARTDLDAIGRITVPVQRPSGVMQVPLSAVARLELTSGASFIYRESQQRYIPIKFGVRGRDLGNVVIDAKRLIQEKVVLPAGYHLEWAGEFGDLQQALARLAVVVPVSLGLIFALLYANFNSVRDAVLAASVMPMAMVGGVFALYVTGTPFSVSAAIGFVALFGISAMDGIIVVSYFNHLIYDGLSKQQAAMRAGQVQLRPVAMTCIAACAGLLPAALSHGIGSQVQRPLALVVVGGISLAPVLIMLVLPVLLDRFGREVTPAGVSNRSTGTLDPE